jgi:hypothetical protein
MFLRRLLQQQTVHVVHVDVVVVVAEPLVDRTIGFASSWATTPWKLRAKLRGVCSTWLAVLCLSVNVLLPLADVPKPKV